MLYWRFAVFIFTRIPAYILMLKNSSSFNFGNLSLHLTCYITWLHSYILFRTVLQNIYERNMAQNQSWKKVRM